MSAPAGSLAQLFMPAILYTPPPFSSVDWLLIPHALRNVLAGCSAIGASVCIPLGCPRKNLNVFRRCLNVDTFALPIIPSSYETVELIRLNSVSHRVNVPVRDLFKYVAQN